MKNNRRNRKLKQIRSTNYIAKQGVIFDSMKISNEMFANTDFLNTFLKQEIKPPMYIRRKFIITLNEIQLAYEGDDYIKDMKTIKRTFTAERKTISQL